MVEEYKVNLTRLEGTKNGSLMDACCIVIPRLIQENVYVT
jgi:hypothetical protein